MNRSISIQIEEERTKLHELVAEFGFADSRVIKQSQWLDSCLNMYASMNDNLSSCPILKRCL